MAQNKDDNKNQHQDDVYLNQENSELVDKKLLHK